MRFRLLLALLLVLTAGHLNAQQREFRFDDARPLGQAARDLETAYGWIVTYEDVPVFGADAKDVTAEVRKDHDANATSRIRTAEIEKPAAIRSLSRAARTARPIRVRRKLVANSSTRPRASRQK